MACFAVRSDDLISPRSELRRDGMIPGLVHTFCPMVFSSLLSDEKPKNGGHFFLSSIAVIITTQYLRSRLSVRGECTTAAVDPRLLRGQYKEEHLGLPIVSAARNGFNLLVVLYWLQKE